MTRTETNLALTCSLFALAIQSGCFSGVIAPSSSLTPQPVAQRSQASSPAPQSSPHLPEGPGSSEAQEAQDLDEQRMLVLINQHRTEFGLVPLKLNPLLIRSSRWLSQDMAARSYLSHSDSLGRNSFRRMDDFGFDLKGWRGENIACGNGDADKTYLQWLNSPGHNANMLGAHYNLIGIARAYDEDSEYGWYWTTDFGSE